MSQAALEIKDTIVEYRLITSLAKGFWDFLIRIKNPRHIPLIGECVNIDGEPYLVYKIGTAIGSPIQPNNGTAQGLIDEYIYIDVSKANTRT